MVKAGLPGGQPYLGTLETVGRRKDGSRFPIELAISQAILEGKPQLIAIAHDITERKEAEARIAHLNRVYAMLSGINTLIVRVRDRDELFREACRIAVEAGGFRMALIAIVDRSAMKIVPVASAGVDEELLTAIKGILSSSEGAPNYHGRAGDQGEEGRRVQRFAKRPQGCVRQEIRRIRSPLDGGLAADGRG